MEDTPEFEIYDKLRGYDLRFQSTYGLFSTREIDSGTRLLIENLKVPQGAICLDFGCGYGPIGITMAKLNPRGKIYFVDRDFVAIEYTARNCRLNNISNYTTVLSDGMRAVPNGVPFDLVASNLPTHISNDMLRMIMNDVKKHLKTGGRFYVVTVSRLKPFIKREFEKIFGNYEKVAHTNTHVVSLATQIQ
jgi:16S rRNA G1207 methylase RsmC